MKRKSIFMFFVVAALFAVLAQSALAYTITIGDSYGQYQAGSGGEFTLLPGNGLEFVLGFYTDGVTKNINSRGTFQSFCLEENEGISIKTTYAATLNYGAVNGGLGGAVNGIDPISMGTAWLYSEFAKGTLVGYNFAGTDAQRKTSALALQYAFWWLEDEGVAYNVSNIFMKAVMDKFGAAAKTDAGGRYGVEVLNLTLNGVLKQDQLVVTSVPIPAAVWLFGTGLIGLVGVRRRFTA